MILVLLCLKTSLKSCFSPGPPISSINKTDRPDIAEILLKVAFNTITPPLPSPLRFSPHVNPKFNLVQKILLYNIIIGNYYFENFYLFLNHKDLSTTVRNKNMKIWK